MDKDDNQPVGQGMAAAQQMDVSAIYPTEFVPEGMSADTDAKSAPNAILEVNRVDKKHRWHGRGLFFWTMLITAVFLLVMLFCWNPLNDNLLHTPLDFGPLTAICGLLLVLVVYGVINAARRTIAAVIKHQRSSLVYYLATPIIAFAALLFAAHFEFKHQFVQFYLTPSVRKVSNVPQAVLRCDRVIGNLFGMTRYGYVSYSNRNIAHMHPTACDKIWDWAVVQDKTDTDSLQMHSLDTVTHEAMHVGGMDSELGATCGSLEWLEDILVDLGASRAEAKRVASAQSKKRENYHGNTAQQKQYEGDCSQVESVR